MADVKNENFNLSDKIFELATKTTFTVDEITDFMSLTGKKYDEVEMLLVLYNKCGISSLNIILILVKLGHYV